jgi:hypothetical protein
MEERNYYRLEYKEETGVFHFEDKKDHPENLCGWGTIAGDVHENRCITFVKEMINKFPGIDSGDKSYKVPTIETIKNEFAKHEKRNGKN